MRALRRLAMLVFLLAVSAMVAAQEVSSWLAKAPEAKSYASIRGALLDLAATAEASLEGDRFLVGRLIEGARKGVPPARLLASLRDQTAVLVQAAEDLGRYGIMPNDRKAAAAYFSQLDILLRAGFALSDFHAALKGSVQREGKKATARNRALAVLVAFAGIELDAAHRRELLEAVAAGPLPDERLFASRARFVSSTKKEGEAGLAAKSVIESLGPTREGARQQDTNPEGEGKTDSTSGAKRGGK